MEGAYLWLSEVMRKWEEHIYNGVKCCVKGEGSIYNWSDGWTLKGRILLITSELMSVKEGAYLLFITDWSDTWTVNRRSIFMTEWSDTWTVNRRSIFMTEWSEQASLRLVIDRLLLFTLLATIQLHICSFRLVFTLHFLGYK